MSYNQIFQNKCELIVTTSTRQAPQMKKYHRMRMFRFGLNPACFLKMSNNAFYLHSFSPLFIETTKCSSSH